MTSAVKIKASKEPAVPENTYLFLAIALPVLAVIGIVAGVFQRLPIVLTAIILLGLLMPSMFLTRRIKTRAFADIRSASRKRAPTIVEKKQDRKLRTIALAMQVFGGALVATGYQIIRKTERIPYYVLGGVLLLIGTIIVGVSVGIMKAAE